MASSEKQAGFTRVYHQAAKKGTAFLDDEEAGVKVNHTMRILNDPSKPLRERIASNLAAKLRHRYTLSPRNDTNLIVNRLNELIAALDSFEVSTSNCRKRKVLDVGCSTGTDLVLLKHALDAQAVTNVEFNGVDLLGAQLIKARENLSEGIFIEGNVTALPFKDGEMDSVQSSRLLIHVPNVAKAVDEMLRVLRPGGCGVFSEGNLHAHMLFTADARLKAVDEAKNAHLIEQCANPAAAMDAYKFLLTRNDVENVEIQPFNMMLSDPSYGLGMTYMKPMLDALVKKKAIKQQDMDYYLDSLPNAQKAGDFLIYDSMFEVSFDKKSR